MKYFLYISAFILFAIVIFTEKNELLTIGWIMFCTALILDKIDEK